MVRNISKSSSVLVITVQGFEYNQRQVKAFSSIIKVLLKVPRHVYLQLRSADTVRGYVGKKRQSLDESKVVWKMLRHSG